MFFPGNHLTKTSGVSLVTVNTPPTIGLTSPAAGTSLAGLADIAIAASALDADGGIAKVEFFRGGTLIGTATGAPYATTWTAAAPGAYTLSARATDNLGGVTTSAGVAVTVTNPISVAIATPAANARFVPPAGIALTATATDAKAGIVLVEYFRGGALIGSATAAPYAATWSNPATGAYAITARATDAQGLTKTSAAVNVVVDAPPSVALTARRPARTTSASPPSCSPPTRPTATAASPRSSSTPAPPWSAPWPRRPMRFPGPASRPAATA